MKKKSDNKPISNFFFKKEIQKKDEIDKELEQFVAKRINADDSKGNNLSHENELLKNLAGLKGITASDVKIQVTLSGLSDNFNETEALQEWLIIVEFPLEEKV